MYILPRLVSASLLCLALFRRGNAAAWEPTPRCNFCLSAAVHDAPGIGFDLTTSYGTAAASLYNGTILQIAQIPASPAYRGLIQRLGNNPTPAPLGRLARWKRWWNKQRGRPATADVEVIASLLAELKSITAKALEQSLDRVAITRPSIPALTAEDIDDALEYAGLRSLLGDASGYHPDYVVESQAVFAGNGHGLCPSYQDAHECWDEAAQLPYRFGLFVSLTRHALYASLDKMREAFPRWTQDGPRLIDFAAGLDRRPKFVSDSEYWAYVRGRLASFLGEGSPSPTLLLLGGENGTNDSFLTVLRDTLSSLNPEIPPSIDIATIGDPTFAAARGMAIYARRRQEVPGHCMEYPNCKREREKQRAGEDMAKVELR